MLGKHDPDLLDRSADAVRRTPVANVRQKGGHRLTPGLGRRHLGDCLVGDQEADATVESTAVKELEEETGFTCERVERLGEFYASPGMVAESFTLVRAHGVRRIGEGGGDENEDITVHLVPRAEIPNFIEQKRAEGLGVDVKLLLLMNF
jgi:ADP-ribose pyrophosphatase